MKRLYFAVTRRCNLRCAHCFNDSGKTLRDEPDAARICSVIEKASAEGFSEIQITGGEALVREDIWDILDFAGAKGLTVLLQTNGVIDDRVMDKLRRSDPERTGFIISVDGFETNDALRGAGVTDRALRSVRVLSGRFRVRINTLLTAQISDSEIRRMIDFAGQTGAALAFNPIIPIGRSGISDMGDPRELFKRMVWIEKAGVNIRKGFTYDAQAKSFCENENCPVRTRDGVFVSADGDCYPCGFFDGLEEMRLGNIMEDGDGFASVMRNYPAGYDEINRECAVCFYYKTGKCFAGCPARIHALHDRFGGREYYCMKQYGEEWMRDV
ncbi:MAG: radical SAM protein [Clostridiales Family XIII bacterium]|jgi:radical SAM protein with 4Fe4S-binding SPASM domain|nr:radical SAM protein [Clostridiales Family XIII bacterium]